MAPARCYAATVIKVLVKWLLLASALLFVAYVYDGVAVHSFGSAMIAAFVIGLLNTVVRPVLVILTLPVTILTVGLFIFVINALMFWLAGTLLHGFEVRSFGAALIGSVLYSILGIVIESALESLFAKK
jgi:putative membrane protein